MNTNGAPIPDYSNPNTVYDFIYTPVNFELYDTLYCNDDDSVILNTGTPTGGFYSGLGVINNVFFPSLLSPGLSSIEYTYNGVTAF